MCLKFDNSATKWVQLESLVLSHWILPAVQERLSSISLGINFMDEFVCSKILKYLKCSADQTQ